MDEAQKAFINSPDTVDFIIRGSDDMDALLKANPEIVPTQTLAGRYVVCYSSKKDFDRAIEKLGTSYVSTLSVVMGLLDRPDLDAAGILKMQQQPYLDLKGRGVLIGIVDTGIDYTQPVFRYEDGTSKIQYIFDESEIGTPPEGFYIGTEYTHVDPPLFEIIYK